MGKYRIMTFDGGGVRGVLIAMFLKRLNKKFPAMIRNVDLFAGTSTGSFIALGLAYGLSPAALVDLYVQNGRSIFSPRYLELFRPKYNNHRLKQVLSSIFPKKLRLKDLKQCVLVPSFRITGDGSGKWGPTFYHNFPNSSTAGEYVIDAALASSAAPVYFPSYRNHIDGGVIVNNPSTAALSLAVDQSAGRQDLQNICLLSFGTGSTSLKIDTNTKFWGAFEWALNPSPPFPLLSILFDGVVEADDHFSSRFLNDRYFRLNPGLPAPVPLDDYRKIPGLVTLAEDYDLDPVISWLTRYRF